SESAASRRAPGTVPRAACRRSARRRAARKGPGAVSGEPAANALTYVASCSSAAPGATVRAAWEEAPGARGTQGRMHLSLVTLSELNNPPTRLFVVHALEHARHGRSRPRTSGCDQLLNRRK